MIHEIIKFYGDHNSVLEHGKNNFGIYDAFLAETVDENIVETYNAKNYCTICNNQWNLWVSLTRFHQTNFRKDVHDGGHLRGGYNNLNNHEHDTFTQ